MFLCGLGWSRVSMGAEKFFQCESSAFLFVFWVLLRFLVGVSGSVFVGLA